jgi:signal transduction histidine kinase
MNLSIRLIIYINDLPVKGINHIDEFNYANWLSLATTPLFYVSAIVMINNFKVSKTSMLIAPLLVVLFALFVMINGMRVTFLVADNPRNTLVMYMLGLIIVGVFFTFEFFESLLLALVTGICFFLLLPFYQHTFNELLMNNMGSLVLLTLFFSLSRYSFSYRADNFLKLKAIEEKNLQIETASLLKNEILGIVAHDLRNPLAAVKTIAMMMEMDKNMDYDNLDNLQMIKASCDKATNIINDLLETAHNELTNELEVEEVELNQFLLIIVDEWVKNTRGGVNILYYGTDKPVYAGINAEKMQRVMDNLISNAMKFSVESDHIEISLKEINNDVFIDVKDFGVGIPPDLQPFIFDRFSRASRKGVRGEESIGLGLSIVRQIIRKHRGEIEVYSTDGGGTTFTIKLAAKRHKVAHNIDININMA